MWWSHMGVNIYKADGFSGQSLWVELSSRATVLDLKREIRARHGIRVSMIVVFLRSTVLENADMLYDMSDTPPWFYIADVLGAKAPRELTLSYVIMQAVCGTCGRPSLHFCRRCRASYCSQACQQRDWKRHRRICKTSV